MSYSHKRVVAASLVSVAVCYLLYLAVGIQAETRKDLYEAQTLATIRSRLRPTDEKFLESFGIFLRTPTHEKLRSTPEDWDLQTYTPTIILKAPGYIK